VAVVADIAARDALVTSPGVQEGDVAVVTSTSQTFIYDGSAWQEIKTPTDGVASIIAGNGITSTGGTNPTIAVDPAVVVRKAGATIGDGAATAFTITHNLNTRDVDVTVYTNAAPYDEVLADVEHTSTTQCTVRFAAAPATNAYRVVVQG
jgi:hypothetical protein